MTNRAEGMGAAFKTVLDGDKAKIKEEHILENGTLWGKEGELKDDINYLTDSYFPKTHEKCKKIEASGPDNVKHHIEVVSNSLSIL